MPLESITVIQVLTGSDYDFIMRYNKDLKKFRHLKMEINISIAVLYSIEFPRPKNAANLFL